MSRPLQNKLSLLAERVAHTKLQCTRRLWRGSRSFAASLWKPRNVRPSPMNYAGGRAHIPSSQGGISNAFNSPYRVILKIPRSSFWWTHNFFWYTLILNRSLYKWCTSQPWPSPQQENRLNRTLARASLLLSVLYLVGSLSHRRAYF